MFCTYQYIIHKPGPASKVSVENYDSCWSSDYYRPLLQAIKCKQFTMHAFWSIRTAVTVLEIAPLHILLVSQEYCVPVALQMMKTMSS